MIALAVAIQDASENASSWFAIEAVLAVVACALLAASLIAIRRQILEREAGERPLGAGVHAGQLLGVFALALVAGTLVSHGLTVLTSEVVSVLTQPSAPNSAEAADSNPSLLLSRSVMRIRQAF